MARYRISGVWKETYDNDISLHEIGEPYKLEKYEGSIGENETSVSALFREALDPLHRPREKQE